MEPWTAVDHYLVDHCLPDDPVLAQALAESQTAGLPNIQVTPNLGRLLQFLARIIGARRILELGTLGGYSSIWLARGLPEDGRLVTLEIAVKHAEVARRNLERAGLMQRVDLRVGSALELLPRLEQERAGPFDLTFIDADKANIAAYFDWAVKLSRPGSLIVVDNVVRKGAVVDPLDPDESVIGVRRFFEQVRHDQRVEVTALQTVGAKGYDGFAVARVVNH